MTRAQKPTDVYAVLLILAAVFYLAAFLLVGPPWGELTTDYDFMGKGAAVSAEGAEAGEGETPGETP